MAERWNTNAGASDFPPLNSIPQWQLKANSEHVYVDGMGGGNYSIRKDFDQFQVQFSTTYSFYSENHLPPALCTKKVTTGKNLFAISAQFTGGQSDGSFNSISLSLKDKSFIKKYPVRFDTPWHNVRYDGRGHLFSMKVQEPGDEKWLGYQFTDGEPLCKWGPRDDESDEPTVGEYKELYYNGKTYVYEVLIKSNALRLQIYTALTPPGKTPVEFEVQQSTFPLSIDRKQLNTMLLGEGEEWLTIPQLIRFKQEAFIQERQGS